MDDLAKRVADRAVSSVFIYTREAHPGENYRHHTTMDDKRDRARSLRSEFGTTRRILLDNLEGDAHTTYGLLPNMTWIIARGGMILYKAAWTDVPDVENALEVALDAAARRKQDRLTTFYSERLAFRPVDGDKFREGLERNGPQAVSDMIPKKD